jgi:hypothetical protein
MSDVQSVPSINNNKLVGSGVGGLGGLSLGTGIVALLTIKYPNFSPTGAAAIGGLLTAVLGSIGTFVAPVLTALQHRAIRALDGSAPPAAKIIDQIAKAQDIVAAAQTFTPKGP